MKKGLLLIITTILCLAVMKPYSIYAEEGDPLTQVARANDYYQKKQYADALAIYEDLISKGYENGYLYYNAGNAYFRLGRLGPAILNYSKAKKFIPRDESVEANLKYSILETKDKLMEPSNNALKNIFFWLEDFSVAENLKAVVVMNIIFWTSWFLHQFYRTDSWKAAKKWSFVLLIIVLISGSAKVFSHLNDQKGVVIVPRVEIKSGSGGDHTTLFELHEGAIVALKETQGEWHKINIKGNKSGWAHKNDILPI